MRSLFRIFVSTIRSTAPNYIFLAAIIGVHHVAIADETLNSGYARAHDGTNIYYEVHGTGTKFLLFGPPLQVRKNREQVEAFVRGFGSGYRLIFVDYPGEPKMYTLTPAAVARDYLEVATVAGAEEFAFYGYSWGAVCGLQLAIRTSRLKALISGGFPMMNGPYSEMLQTTRAIASHPYVANDKDGRVHTPEAARQYLTFYEGLQSFDDRSVQDGLKVPRLNFIGTEDQVTFDGGVNVDFYRIAQDSKNEMKSAGWDVIFLPGENHGTARAPSVVIPLVRKWLDANWH